MTPNCTDCEYYKASFYKKPTAKKPDARCIHERSRLGRDLDSFMTISEARLPPSKVEIHGVSSNNDCGPSGRLFVLRRA